MYNYSHYDMCNNHFKNRDAYRTRSKYIVKTLPFGNLLSEANALANDVHFIFVQTDLKSVNGNQILGYDTSSPQSAYKLMNYLLPPILKVLSLKL